MSNYSFFLRFISPKGGVVLGKGVISTDEMNAAANRVTCWQVQFVNARMALVEVICINMYFYHRQEVQYRWNYVLKIIHVCIFMNDNSLLKQTKLFLRSRTRVVQSRFLRWLENPAVIRLKYCRYGVKHNPINQSINQIGRWLSFVFSLQHSTTWPPQICLMIMTQIMKRKVVSNALISTNATLQNADYLMHD